MATSESKGRFFLQNESIRIANWNALLDRPICAGGADTPPCYAPVVGGGGLSDTAIRPSVCLPQGAAALGVQLP